MPEIKFETGIVSFKLNDAAEVSFNPTDSAFVEQIFNTFDELDGKQEAYKAEIDRCADKKEIFAIARRRDAEMRDMIDGLFAKPVCADLFGTMNVYALADGLHISRFFRNLETELAALVENWCEDNTPKAPLVARGAVGEAD